MASAELIDDEEQSTRWRILHTTVFCSCILFISGFILFAGWRVSTAAGWQWALYCFLWGSLIWSPVIYFISRAARQGEVSFSLMKGIAGMLAILAATALPPFALMAAKFGSDIAGEGASIAFIGPMALLMLVVLCIAAVWYFTPDARRYRAQQTFEAKLRDGPVGRWQSLSASEDESMDSTYELEFTADGQGCLVEHSATRGDSLVKSTSFRWRLIGKRRIEISLPPATVREFEMTFVYGREDSTEGLVMFHDEKKLALLRSKQQDDRESLLTDPQFAEDLFWPSSCYLAPIGPIQATH